MSVEIIQQRLLTYDCKTIVDQENALKEIAQAIALMALSRAGFFSVAAFQGGASLKILYGLERFSEELNFTLKKPTKNFDWADYIKNMQEEFSAYGYAVEMQNKLKLSGSGTLLINDVRTNRLMLQIKLEVNIHPPKGSAYELKYLDFPLAFSVQTQDLPSLFANTSYVLLCDERTNGRDWYDFSWFVAQKTQINFPLLSSAIGNNKTVTPEWYFQHVRAKINEIDWAIAKKDIERFLLAKELPALDAWSKDFFLSRVDKMQEYIT